MNNISNMEKQKYIFGKLQIMTNKLKVIENTTVDGEEMTISQWLLTLAIAQFSETSPTLGEVVELMGSTRQNVKQLAVKLERKGFLRIERDKRDHRVIRFVLTERSYFYWEEIEVKFKNMLLELFTNFNEVEVNSLYDCINKLYKRITKKAN